MPDLTVSPWSSRRPRRRSFWGAAGRRLLVLALLPLLVTGGVPAVAQDGARTIEAIEFRGLKSLTEDTLRYYLGLEPGQPLDEAALNARIKDLWDRDLIDDIQVETVPGDAGVRLVITIVERPILRSVEYEGVKRVGRTEIQDKIVTQRIQVREGEPMSLGELQRVKTLIQDMYAEKGYRFAEARYTVEDIGTNEKRVVFTVDEGDRVRIADVAFEGNTVFNDVRLQLAMRKVKETGPISRFTKKDIYDPAKLQEDLEKVRDVYRGAGYKNVVIGEPQVEVRALKPEAARPEDQKRRMFITVPIEEGDRWKFGEVSIEGNETYSDEALLRIFQHRPNSWLRAKVVDEGVKSVRDLYNNTGYIYAQVEPELVEKPGQVADVVIHVQEGDQFKVGRIEFQGNERTMDKVLRREVRLVEGGLVNIGGLRNSVLKVNQLGYFKLNEEDPVEIATNNEEKSVDLVFKGEEAERTELQFGGGWSELDGFFGQFAINTKNFLGRGEQVGVSLQTGRFRDFFDVSYFIPWFLDRRQSIGIRLFDSDIDYSDLYEDDERFLRNSRGAILTYGRSFRLFQSASMSYNRSNYDEETTVPVLNPTTNEVENRVVPFTRNSSSLRPIYVFDSRDNPFETTRGTRFSLGAEYAGGPLGGDSYFVRPEVNFSYFRPVGDFPTRTVAALNFEAGMINAFDEKENPLSPFERFFLGGENSIRGHRSRSLYQRKPNGEPLRDPLTNSILGGDKFVQLNLEYHFLLGGPFRVLLFGDAANVFADDQSIDLSNLRYTAGAELRVLVPVFGAPLRFIYAVNLDEQPGDRFEEFQFSIGTSF